jgi:hypothetical protein
MPFSLTVAQSADPRLDFKPWILYTWCLSVITFKIKSRYSLLVSNDPDAQ